MTVARADQKDSPVEETITSDLRSVAELEVALREHQNRLRILELAEEADAARATEIEAELAASPFADPGLLAGERRSISVRRADRTLSRQFSERAVRGIEAKIEKNSLLVQAASIEGELRERGRAVRDAVNALAAQALPFFASAKRYCALEHQLTAFRMRDRTTPRLAALPAISGLPPKLIAALRLVLATRGGK